MAVTIEGAREHIDELSRKYLGRPYPGSAAGSNACFSAFGSTGCTRPDQGRTVATG
ncbi:hypothetical protein TPA0908_57800 [Micromonospora sp. AKA38]|nr:hypothetical protein TPA0908_57800 [Micromonospora sp. AKA38]